MARIWRLYLPGPSFSRLSAELADPTIIIRGGDNASLSRRLAIWPCLSKTWSQETENGVETIVFEENLAG